MGKPILFDTISRSKFDNLGDDIKAKRNYQIKEEDGTISKHIAGLEVKGGDSGSGMKVFEFFTTSYMGEERGITVNTIEEIDEYWENSGPFIISGVFTSSGGEYQIKAPIGIMAEISDCDFALKTYLLDFYLTFGLANTAIPGYEDYYTVMYDNYSI